VVVPVLGVVQVLAWGSSFYLPAVLAGPIAEDTGWPLPWTVGAFSLAMLVSGLAAPKAGVLIERRGGRPVLAGGTALLAAGLALLGLSPSLPVHVAAWLVIGLGMAGTLYEAAFAALGRLYGASARGPITDLTLIGGFASTACWPLSAAMLDAWGWRAACLAYAGVHLAVVLPLVLLLYPREAPRSLPAAPPPPDPASRAAALRRRGLVAAFAGSVAVGALVATAVSVHLLELLRAGGLGLAAAVALGALVGPSQVAGRIVEKLFGRRWHPVWTLVASHALVTAGLGLLMAGFPAASACLVLYGAGIGLRSIARGTVPLVLFGADGYAVLMGRIALPILLAQAAAPSAAALGLERAGADALMATLVALSAAGAALSLALVPAALRRTRPG
jgi:MFS family permease